MREGSGPFKASHLHEAPPLVVAAALGRGALGHASLPRQPPPGAAVAAALRDAPGERRLPPPHRRLHAQSSRSSSAHHTALSLGLSC